MHVAAVSAVFIIGAALYLLVSAVNNRKQKDIMANANIMPDQNGRVDLGQVRALEAQLLTELNAVRARETKRNLAFRQLVGGYSDQLAALQAKFTAAMQQQAQLPAGAPVVDTQDYTADFDALKQALDTAQALGLETVADFMPASGVVVAVPGVPISDQPEAGSIVGAAEAAAEKEAAAAQAAQDQSAADQAAVAEAAPVAEGDQPSQDQPSQDQPATDQAANGPAQTVEAGSDTAAVAQGSPQEGSSEAGLLAAEAADATT